MRTMRFVGVLGLLALGACAQNPMAPPTGPGSGVQYNGIVETITPDVLYAPQSASQMTTLWGGAIQYSYGGASCVYTTGMVYTCGVGPNSNLVMGSPGIGGPYGNFTNSYYLRYIGYKGPDASLDYNSLVVNFLPGQYVVRDLSQYHGFIFFARGTGNFGVQLGATGAKTGQANGPYKDYNYYESVFGGQLSSSWKQFTVNFSDMQQLYGAVVDKTLVIQNAFGLGFLQEKPYVQNFTLDLDYIRFF